MLTLTRINPGPIPVEAECFTPDRLAPLSPAEIARLPVWHGNAGATVADLFRVDGDPADGCLRLEGDCSRVKLVGSGMTRGRIEIRGDAGMHLGAGMRGGAIEVFGSASDWVGAEMRGGRLHVHGDVGHLAGAAYRGSRLGMRGGILVIDDNAGDEVGCTMRRGVIIVGGDVGEFAGAGMLAGTIGVWGTAGRRVGAGMKRGTIILNRPAELLPTFRPACSYQPVFLTLYCRALRRSGVPVPAEIDTATWVRHCGDLVAGGKGEILTNGG